MTAEPTLTPPREHAPRDAEGQSRTALVSIAAALFLVVLKLGTGLITGSLGLVSAGIESSGDVVAAVLTFGAIRLGGGPARRGHPPRPPPAGEPGAPGGGGGPRRRRRGVVFVAR